MQSRAPVLMRPSSQDHRITLTCVVYIKENQYRLPTNVTHLNSNVFTCYYLLSAPSLLVHLKCDAMCVGYPINQLTASKLAMTSSFSTANGFTLPFFIIELNSIALCLETVAPHWLVAPSSACLDLLNTLSFCFFPLSPSLSIYLCILRCHRTLPISFCGSVNHESEKLDYFSFLLLAFCTRGKKLVSWFNKYLAVLKIVNLNSFNPKF